jgi:O-methyltransferase
VLIAHRGAVLKKAVKSILARLGLRVQNGAVAFERRKVVSGMQYSTVLPLATYSPWLDDLEFIRVYRSVENNTLVDRYRCFELWELVGQVSHLPGDILEVGVWRGGSGGLVAAKAKLMGMKKVIYLCDTFAGVVKVTEEDSSYVGGEHADATEGQVLELIQLLDVGDVRIRKGIFPDNFLDEMRNSIFSFVHIDVDVSRSAKDIMSFAWPRLSVGGIVVFDDFGFDTCDGIAKLIADYRGNSDKIILHNLNGHAVLVKIR